MIDETAPVLHRAAHIGSRSGAGPGRTRRRGRRTGELASSERFRDTRPRRTCGDPRRPVGRPSSLRRLSGRPVPGAGLQRGPRPPLPAGPVAPPRTRPPVRGVRQAVRRTRPRRPPVPLSRRHGRGVERVRRGHRTDHHGVRERHQRLRVPVPPRSLPTPGGIRNVGLRAGILEALGRRPDPQSRPAVQPPRRGRPRLHPARPRHRRRGLAPPPRTRPAPPHRPRGPRSERHPGRRAARVRPRDGPALAGRRRPPGHRRLQQLGARAVQDRHRPPHPRQRPAPRGHPARAALHRAPDRTRHRRHRRGRTRPARPLHRPQREHRLRLHDLPDRPGGPVRLRDRPRRPRAPTATKAAGKP